MRPDSTRAGGRWRSWLGAAALAGAAAIQTVPNAGRLNPDGVSYLDLAQRVAHGHVQDIFLGYWSPLFSILVAPFLVVIPVGPPTDTILGYGVLFLTFALAAAGFRYLLRQLAGGETPGSTPETVYRLAAWAIFAWATLGLIRLHYISPDMLTAALFFWATGLALRAARGPGAAAAVAAFGVGAVWGLAGMAKAAMLPLALVGILSFVLAAPGLRAALRRGGLAAAGWLVVAGPFIVGLSLQAGEPSIGSAGQLNYRWAVVNERGSEAAVVDEVHVRGMPVEPHITHLYRYDPVRPRRDRPRASASGGDGGFRLPSIGRQVRRLMASAEDYWFLFGPLAAALLALLLMDRGTWGWRRWRTLAPIWLPALAGVGLYGMVYVLPRYVAPFLAMLAVAVLAAARPDARYATARGPVLGGLSAVLLAFAAMATVHAVRLPGGRDARAAARLLEAGPERGDRVAVVGNALDLSPVLRAGELRVAATLARREAARFRVADPEVQEAAIDAMAKAGAEWILFPKPVNLPGPGWRQVRGSDLWLRRLEASHD